MALAFFGFAGILRGYLVLRSTFLPRFLGVGILGAMVTILWLLIAGVDEQRWKEQANLATASIWR